MGSLPAVDDRLWYPTARRDDSVAVNYHGVTVRDPYRYWLEDGDSEETKEFVEEQNKLMEIVLSKCETRQNLSEKLTQVYDFPRYDAPFRAGDHYFYFHNSGLQPQRVLYIQSAVAVNRTQILESYLSDVKNVLQLRDLETGRLLQRLPLDIGTVYRISARRKDSIAFVGFTSFVVPGIIYTCNLQSDVPEMKILREIVVPGFDRSQFHVTQAFYPSNDGTKIPMFIVGRKGMSLDGSHPCLLYGYGGFNTSLTPSFNVSRSVIAKHLGVVLCVANIRGGGEYGEEWHKAGTLSKKQNVFDDFISAAEYLISAGYTHSTKLCIEGGSNGGLLVGACINQRPDLFACALPHVGVMDMLRFHKFTIGEVLGFFFFSFML